MESHPHKNIRLHPKRYIGQMSYFVTICCEGRRPLFANRARAAWLIDILRKESTAHRFAVHAYCVMPDHFHMLVVGLDECCDLLEFVLNFKRASEWGFYLRHKNRKKPTEKRPRTARATVAATNPALWQKKFYDHILRPADNFDGVAGYIWMNPARAGLCVDPRNFPHSGSFVIDWKAVMQPLESWVPEWKK